MPLLVAAVVALSIALPLALTSGGNGELDGEADPATAAAASPTGPTPEAPDESAGDAPISEPPPQPGSGPKASGPQSPAPQDPLPPPPDPPAPPDSPTPSPEPPPLLGPPAPPDLPPPPEPPSPEPLPPEPAAPAEATTDAPAPAPPTTVAPPPPTVVPSPAEPDWGEIARSVVLVWASGCSSAGSGTVVLDGQYVLTNAHVVLSEAGRTCTGLSVGFSERVEDEPTEWISAMLVALEGGGLDSLGHATLPDLAVLRLSRRPGRPAIPITAQQLELNAEIVVLGYPGIGGETVTLVRGVYAGVGESEGHDVLKTDADISPGNSGGAAFDTHGVLIGIPTFSSVAEDRASDLGWLIPAAEADRFLARHVG